MSSTVPAESSLKYDSPDDEQAHKRAKEQDARELFSIGDIHEAVVTQTAAENNGRQAITNLENVYVFLNDEDQELRAGDLVTIRLFDVGESYAKGVILEQLDTPTNTPSTPGVPDHHPNDISDVVDHLHALESDGHDHVSISSVRTLLTNVTDDNHSPD